jgi:hypothetical protein
VTGGPAAEVRRAGLWRWTVILTGVRGHAAPRTVHGPAAWARCRAAAMLARAAPGRPPDFTVRLGDGDDGDGGGGGGQLEPPRAADILAGHAAAGFAGPQPVNLYRSAGPPHTEYLAEPVRVIGRDGETVWEGIAGVTADQAAEVLTIWPGRPPGDPGGGFLP